MANQDDLNKLVKKISDMVPERKDKPTLNAGTAVFEWTQQWVKDVFVFRKRHGKGVDKLTRKLTSFTDEELVQHAEKIVARSSTAEHMLQASANEHLVGRHYALERSPVGLNEVVWALRWGYPYNLASIPEDEIIPIKGKPTTTFGSGMIFTLDPADMFVVLHAAMPFTPIAVSFKRDKHTGARKVQMGFMPPVTEKAAEYYKEQVGKLEAWYGTLKLEAKEKKQKPWKLYAKQNAELDVKVAKEAKEAAAQKAAADERHKQEEKRRVVARNVLLEKHPELMPVDIDAKNPETKALITTPSAEQAKAFQLEELVEKEMDKFLTEEQRDAKWHAYIMVKVDAIHKFLMAHIQKFRNEIKDDENALLKTINELGGIMIPGKFQETTDEHLNDYELVCRLLVLASAGKAVSDHREYEAFDKITRRFNLAGGRYVKVHELYMKAVEAATAAQKTADDMLKTELESAELSFEAKTVTWAEWPGVKDPAVAQKVAGALNKDKAMEAQGAANQPATQLIAVQNIPSSYTPQILAAAEKASEAQEAAEKKARLGMLVVQAVAPMIAKATDHILNMDFKSDPPAEVVFPIMPWKPETKMVTMANANAINAVEKLANEVAELAIAEQSPQKPLWNDTVDELIALEAKRKAAAQQSSPGPSVPPAAVDKKDEEPGSAP